MSLIYHHPTRGDSAEAYKLEYCGNPYSYVSTFDNLAVGGTGTGPTGEGCFIIKGSTKVTHKITIPKTGILSYSFWVGIPKTSITKAEGGYTAIVVYSGSASIQIGWLYYNDNLYIMISTYNTSGSQLESTAFDPTPFTELESHYPEGSNGVHWVPIAGTINLNSGDVEFVCPAFNSASINVGDLTTIAGKEGYVELVCDFPKQPEITDTTYQPYFRLADVKLYDHKLSLRQAKDIENKLVAQYNFTQLYDSTSTKAVDASGYRHDATLLQGEITKSADTALGSTSAQLCTSAYTRLQFNDWAALEFTDDFSFNIWVKHLGLIGTEAAEYIFNVGRCDMGGLGYGLEVVNNSTLRIRCEGVSLNLSIAKDEWHMITMTCSNKTVKAYVDGVLKSSGSFSTYATYEDSYGVNIGSFYGGYYSKSNIANLKIYASALSEDEITKLYNAKIKVDTSNRMMTTQFIENSSSVSFTKNGVVNCNSIVENEYMIVDGAKYLKIFSHDARTDTTMFSSLEEAKLAVNKTNRFSRLVDIPKLIGLDGYYQFMLRYPVNYPGEYNAWKQTVNPFTVTADSSQTADMMGYQAVHIDWTRLWGCGMGLSSNSECLLDTYAGNGYWHGGIGQTVIYRKGFPTPVEDSVSGPVELWIRVDNVDYKQASSMKKTDEGTIIFMDEFIEE